MPPFRPSPSALDGPFLSVRGAARVSPLAGFLLLLLGGPVGAQNLATNPGFETGNTTGWFAFGPPTISAQTGMVRSGNYAALVQNRSSTWNGIAQSLLGVLTPGQTCDVSVWVRLVSGGPQTMQLTVQQVDGAGTTYTPLASASVTATNWTPLAGQFTLTVSGSLTTLVLYAEMPSSSTASFYLDDLSVTPVASGTVTGQCTVNWTNQFQRIDGFGASSAWRSTWTAAQADLFFSTNNGIGLSLLRTRITPAGTTVETTIAQMAQARGARVWSAPWSPPTALKSTNANGVISVNGGAFVGTPANYEAYARHLAGYVATQKFTHGVNLYAISIQNEPNHNTTNYESCVWTGQQFREFIPYLSAALVASNVADTKIMLPESIHWATTSLHTPAMNDPAVAPLVGIIANHNYDGPNFETGATTPPAALNNYGKSLWQTEVCTGDPYDGGISNAVYWAGRIHQFMTVAQAHAWHYWWLVPTGWDNQGLTDPSVNPAKRMYALGQFSRFVRPGFHRIGVGSQTGPLQISAYKEPTNGALAIVVINPTANHVVQTFHLSGFGLASVTPWITSASQSLASQPAVPVMGTAFTNTIPPLSIVTFVGQAQPANVAPTLAPMADVAVGAGVPLSLTNLATDANVPPQILTFSLLTAPAGAALNATNGVFTWRPSVTQAGTTNLVTVKVADDGVPPESATNSFTIVVHPLTPAVISAINLAGGQPVLTVEGTQGPDYTVLASTNLVSWLPLFTTNAPVVPVTLTVPVSATNRAEFFRVEMGP
jgi:glucuronoarabinoxylan endo-1,4-beta-xylanase